MRAVVRWLIAPLVRWAAVGSPCQMLRGRNEDGLVFLLLLDCWGTDMELLLTPDEARDWCRGMMKLARDAQEGCPLVDPKTIPPL